MARSLRSLLRLNPENIPPLTTSIAPMADLPNLANPQSLLSTRVTVGRWTDSESPERPRSIWPKIDYFEQAAKLPASVFKDREMRRCQYTFESAAGKHGIVFHLRGQKHFAVKCFLKDLPDREIRFYELRNANLGAAKPYFIDFEFQREGIHDGKGHWFPVLKMDWVNGVTLDKFVLERLLAGDKKAPDALLFKFRAMVKALDQAGIAHGDLSPSNILVTQAGLKLVDYDNVFVPALSGSQSGEFGEPLYQHPGRSLKHFGSYMDNYPAWVIDNVLTFLSTYPDSFHWGWDYIVQLVRDDHLLYFNQVTNQLVDPILTFGILPEVRRRANLMHYLMQFPMEQVPPIMEDFSTNLLKREQLMQSVNRMLGRQASP
jgi:hypothetical protein